MIVEHRVATLFELVDGFRRGEIQFIPDVIESASGPWERSLDYSRCAQIMESLIHGFPIHPLTLWSDGNGEGLSILDGTFRFISILLMWEELVIPNTRFGVSSLGTVDLMRDDQDGVPISVLPNTSAMLAYCTRDGVLDANRFEMCDKYSKALYEYEIPVVTVTCSYSTAREIRRRLNQ